MDEDLSTSRHNYCVLATFANACLRSERQMKIRLSHLKKIIKEEVRRAHLSESLEDIITSDMAAVVTDTGTARTAVVYNVDALITALGRRRLDTLKVVGIVQISKPQGAPCRGAWMIRGITGPGKIMYGLAYAMSPTGLVVPDRSSVSPSAAAAWKKYSVKAEPNKIFPLDDASHPARGKDAQHDKYHTEDPGDDCFTSHDEEFLNAAYKGPGGEVALLNRLTNNHERVLKMIDASGRRREEIESEVLDAGFMAFDIAMDF